MGLNFFWGEGGGQGHALRCLLYPLPHWWSGLFIISVIHGCFMLFLSSWAPQSPASRNSLFQALLLPSCLYIVVLVYNPVLLSPFLMNFMFLGSAEPTFQNCYFAPSFHTGAVLCCDRYTFFTGGAYMVIIAVTILRVLEEPQHVLLPNTCSICDIRL